MAAEAERHELRFQPDVGEKYILMEVDDALLTEIMSGHASLKGDSEMVLCTNDKTFQVRPQHGSRSLLFALCKTLIPRSSRENPPACAD